MPHRLSRLAMFIIISLWWLVIGVVQPLPAKAAPVTSPLVWHELKDDPKDTNPTRNKRYLELAYEFLMVAEGARPYLYADKTLPARPAIGIGYDLTVEPVRTKVLEALGLQPAVVSDQAQRATIQKAIDAITAKLQKFNQPKPPKPVEFNSPTYGYGGDVGQLQTDLDQIMSALKHNQNVLSGQTLPLNEQLSDKVTANIRPMFGFADVPAAANKDLFMTVAVKSAYESAIDRELAVPPSLERVALLSLTYAGVQFRTNVGPTKLLQAIQAGDRAAVWYEIRYNSQPSNDSMSAQPDQAAARLGAVRRNFESDLFGLYSGDPYGRQALASEAKRTLAMLQTYRSQLYQSVIPHPSKPTYNNRFYVNPDELVASAARDFATPLAKIRQLGFANFTIRSRDQLLQPSVDYFLATKLVTDSANGVFVFNQPQSVVELKQRIGTNASVFLQTSCSTSQELKLDNANNVIYAAGGAVMHWGSGVNHLRVRGHKYTINLTGLVGVERQNLPLNTIKYGDRLVSGRNLISGRIYQGWRYDYRSDQQILRITSPTWSLTIDGFRNGDFGVSFATTAAPANPLKPDANWPLRPKLPTMPPEFPATAAPLPCPAPTPTRRVIFSGQAASGQPSLWTSDGTEAGTKPITVPRAYSYGLNPQEVTAMGGRVVFRGTNSEKLAQLWVSDGTEAGTKELTNQAITDERQTIYGVAPTEITSLGHKAVFSGFNQLWVTDGTVAGTQALLGIAQAATPLVPSNIMAFGNRAIFTGFNDRQELKLWVTDGTVAGTQPFDLPNASNLFNHRYVTNFGGKALLSGTDKNNRNQLWLTDGTTAGSQQLTNLVTTSGAGVNPQHITVFGNRAIFRGHDAQARPQLWQTDGTVAGTYILTGIKNAPVGGLAPSRAVTINNRVIFSTTDQTNWRSSLWATDGTSAGTIKLTDTSQSANTAATAAGRAAFNDGERLWLTDGTVAGTVAVSNVAANQLVGFGSSFLVSGSWQEQPKQLLAITGHQVKELSHDQHKILNIPGFGVEPTDITVLNQ